MSKFQDLAKCDECPLKYYHQEQGEWNPTPTEYNGDDKPLMVLNSPTLKSYDLHRPIMGEEGVILLKTLRSLGLKREDFNYTYAVACRYPAGDERKFLAQLRTKNKKAKQYAKDAPPIEPDTGADTDEEQAFNPTIEPGFSWPTPVACCRPRLLAETSHSGKVITLGKGPTAALTHGNPDIMEVRGGPTYARINADNPEDTTIRVLPTFDPMNVSMNLRWKDIFAMDIAKALRYFNNKLVFPNIEIIYHPDADTIRRYLQKWKDAGKWISSDIETDAKDPLQANIRCIGMGVKESPGQAVVLMLGFYSVLHDYGNKDCPLSDFYDAVELPKVLAVLREFFTDPTTKWTGHNFRVYDWMALENRLGFYPVNVVDTIALAHAGNNELPRGLAFQGSIYTDAHAWKAEHTAVTAKSDEELYKYCATDIIVDYEIAPKLLDIAQKHKQTHIYRRTTKLQDYAVGMHKIGQLVDNKRLYWHYLQQEQARAQARGEARAIVGNNFNPNSYGEIRKILFTDRKCPIFKLTDSLEPSTDDTTCRQLLFSSVVDDETKEFIKAIRKYRTANKVITTYLKPLSPLGYQVLDDRSSKTFIGTINSNYNATGTLARYASNEPNMQNIPDFLRSIFLAGDGYKYLYYDADQLELRMVVGLADAQFYKKCLRGETVFGKHFEPHNLTGFLMYGEAYFQKQGAPTDYTKKGDGKFKELRDLIKTMYYLFQYGGQPPKMMSKIMEAEKDDGTPIYDYVFTDKGIVKVEAMYDKMLEALPEIPKYWKSCMQFYRKHGYIEEPIWLRRRQCGDGPNPNDLSNFPAQAGGFAIVAEAMDRVQELIPHNFINKTGLVAQTHDSGIWRVREDDAEELNKQMPGLLNSKHFDVDFSWEGDIVDRWKEFVLWDDKKQEPGKDAGWENSKGMEGFELSWLDRLVAEQPSKEETLAPYEFNDVIPF